MSTGRHVIEEKLGEIATPEIYRRNAFRVLGLRTDASPTDVRRIGKRLETALKVGSEIKVSRVPPYSAEITVDEVTAAIHVLQDPINRIVHELFWFWPMEAEGSDDRAILLLEQNDPNGAIAIWNEAITTKRKRSKATHNLAMLFHTWALWFENLHKKGQLAQDDIAKMANYWELAYHYWYQSIGYPGFRVQLETRIAEISDPRLTPESAEVIDDALINSVIRISVGVAIAHATSGHTKSAHTTFARLREGPFDKDSIYQVVKECILPETERVKAACKNVGAELKDEPKLGHALANRLVKDTALPLSTLDVFVTYDEEETAEDSEEDIEDEEIECYEPASALKLIVDQTYDLVADTIETCAGQFVQATHEWREVGSILHLARRFARSQLLISRLDEAIVNVESSMDAVDNAHASVLVGQANEATEHGDYSKAADLLKRAWEICKDKTYKQQIYGWWQSAKVQPSAENADTKDHISTHARTSNWRKSLPYLIIIAIVVFIFVNDQISRRDLVSTRSAIELERSELRGMEGEIAGLDSVLGIMKNELQSYRAQVNKFEWQIANGLDVNKLAYDAALKRHNELVKRHNALVADRISKYSLYDAKLKSFNERVRQYNAGARR
ncbi:hypothetical protein HUU59_10625 [bacterium]|nr:hypothetical protein [bacterium]